MRGLIKEGLLIGDDLNAYKVRYPQSQAGLRILTLTLTSPSWFRGTINERLSCCLYLTNGALHLTHKKGKFSNASPNFRPARRKRSRETLIFQRKKHTNTHAPTSAAKRQKGAYGEHCVCYSGVIIEGELLLSPLVPNYSATPVNN